MFIVRNYKDVCFVCMKKCYDFFIAMFTHAGRIKEIFYRQTVVKLDPVIVRRRDDYREGYRRPREKVLAKGRQYNTVTH